MRYATPLLVAATALAAASPAHAINDGRVPAGQCAPDHSAAVGHPFPELAPSNPGLVTAGPVDPPASGNNPGVATGAKGQEKADPRC